MSVNMQNDKKQKLKKNKKNKNKKSIPVVNVSGRVYVSACMHIWKRFVKQVYIDVYIY